MPRLTARPAHAAGVRPGRKQSLISSAPVARSIALRHLRPHRLEAQDTALSRRQHRFESGWGRQRFQYLEQYPRSMRPKFLANIRAETYLADCSQSIVLAERR